jgi:hypothetical protein
MSFREKTAWVSLVSMSGIYGVYFWRGRLNSEVHGLLGTIIALTFVQTVLMIAVAIISPKDANAPLDEREKLIDLKATRFAYPVLAGSLACACFFAAVDPKMVFKTNALLLILVVAEVFRSGCQIVQYRRSA